MEKNNQIYMQLSIASPYEIEKWADNKLVYNPSGFHFFTNLPVRGGLFCEGVFGSLRKNQCQCGKYKNIHFSGLVCEKCGVEISQKNLRRERMGYIYLTEPIIHPWFIQDDEYSYISNLIDLSNSDIKNLQDKKSYIILSQGYTNLVQKNQIFNETEIRLILTELLEDIRATIDSNNEVFSLCNEYIKQLNHSYYSSYEKPNYNKFFDITRKYLGIEFGTGVYSILELLEEIDLDLEILKTERLLKEDTENIKLQKKLQTLLLFKKSNTKPECLVLKCIPVMPADFRHYYRDANHVISINKLYRDIIETNNRAIDNKSVQNYMYMRQEITKLKNLINKLYNEKEFLNINFLSSFLEDITLLYTNEKIDVQRIKASLFKHNFFVFTKPSRSLLELIKILNSFGISVSLYNDNNEELQFDKEGFDSDGYNIFGLKEHSNIDEYDCNGFNILGFDKYGFDEKGFDSDGFNINGINKNGSKYDNFGFDFNGMYAGKEEYSPKKLDVLGYKSVTKEEKIIENLLDTTLYSIEYKTHTKEEFKKVFNEKGVFTTIDYLNLSCRTYKTLIKNNITNILKLKKLDFDEFIKKGYIGASSVYKMIETLNDYHISIKIKSKYIFF